LAIVNVAVPPTRVWAGSAVPSTVSVTLPVGVPDLDVTVTVTDPLLGTTIEAVVMVVVVDTGGGCGLTIRETGVA
jgi:hypothetical protein